MTLLYRLTLHLHVYWAKPNSGPFNNYVTLFWEIFEPPPPFLTLFNVVLTTVRNASLNPPSRCYVIVEWPLVNNFIPVYSQNCVTGTCQMVYLLKCWIEFRKMFRIAAKSCKWLTVTLDDNGYKMLWWSLENWLTGYRKANFYFGPSFTVGQTINSRGLILIIGVDWAWCHESDVFIHE